MSLPGFADIEGLTDRALSCANEFVAILMHRNRNGEKGCGRFTPEDAAVSPRFEKHFKISGPEVRALVQHLRREGNPIGSNQNGYYWAVTREELQGTIDQLESRARSCATTAQALKEIKF